MAGNACVRILMPGYVAGLRLLTRGPVTWMTFAEKLNVSRATAQRLAHGFHDKGLSHVADWQPKAEGSVLLVPVYRYGAGADAPHPSGKVQRTRKRTIGIELRTFCNAVFALREDRLGVKALAEAVGLQAHSASRLLKEMRAQHLIYIADYEIRINRGYGYPLYAWGLMRNDLPKPPPMTKQEAWAKHNVLKAARQRQKNLLLALQGNCNPRRRLPEFGASNADTLSQRA